MKNGLFKLLTLFIISVLFPCFLSANLPTDGVLPGSYADSLAFETEKMPSADERMEYLSQQSTTCANSEREQIILKELIRQAHEDRSAKWQCFGWKNLARNYYNRSDTVTLLIDCLENLKKVEGAKKDDRFYSVALSDVESFVCFMYVAHSQFQMAMDVARSIADRAETDDDNYARVTAYEAMGIIYSKTRQFKDAVLAYENGYNAIRNDKASVTYGLQLLNELSGAALDAKNYAKAEETLAKVAPQIKLCCQQTNFPYADRCYLLMEVFYIQLYAKTGNAEKAALHIAQAQKYLPLVDDEYVYRNYYYGCALYYQLVGDTDKAIATLKQTVSYTLDMLELMTDLQLKKENHKDAVVFMRDEIDLLHDQIDEEFNQQLNELRTRYEVNRLQMEAQEANLRAAQLRLRMTTISLVVFALIVIVLLYLVVLLRKAKHKAEEASRIKTQFMQNMNHEMRTPLNAIIGFSTILTEDEELDESYKELVNLVRNNGELLLQLVTDTLESTVLETENKHVELREADLVQLCREAVLSSENRLQAGVKLVYSPGAERCLIQTDKMRMKQMLLNLLTNAAKFTEKGQIELEFTPLPEEHKVRITVTDTGCGIPVEQHEKVFERFVKLDTFTQGTGLGLSICRQIAEVLHGRIYIDSTYTGGTRFVVEHPL